MIQKKFQTFVVFVVANGDEKKTLKNFSRSALVAGHFLLARLAVSTAF
jgi:hypothetical protein